MHELRHPECQRLFLREVDRQARRLARRYNLQPTDRDDAFQEIALDAWRRLTRYKAIRGDLQPFLAVVTLNQARKIEMRFCRRRACPEVSLDTPIVADCADGDLTLGDSLTQDDGLPALLGNVVDGHARSELMLDLSRAIARLPSEMRRLCACLAHETPGIARRLCGLSNTGMYRQLEELRLHFRTYDLATS
jgi:DNA-directed RNA polymerase specialized sigma24 family protein